MPLASGGLERLSTQASAPIALAQSLINQIESRKVLGGAELAGEGAGPDGALHLRGEFTVLNPGSRGKRFWVGMGAGRSRVCVKGELVDGEGRPLFTFEHCRSGTGSWSFVGGRSEGLMISDLSGTAEKLSAFLESWSHGGEAEREARQRAVGCSPFGAALRHAAASASWTIFTSARRSWMTVAP